MTLSNILLFAIGLLIFTSAALNWDWLMNGRRAQATSRLLGGRNRTRILYILIGAALIVLAVLNALKVLP